MKYRIKKWAIENRFYLLAFVIPFLTAVIAFAAQGVWPFGERGITIIDSYHQYLPFFSELQYKWRIWRRVRVHKRSRNISTHKVCGNGIGWGLR